MYSVYCYIVLVAIEMARQQSEEVRSLLEKETQYNQYVHKQQHMKEEVHDTSYIMYTDTSHTLQ